jgi:ParB-like chromosome segregation protein Spo0J
MVAEIKPEIKRAPLSWFKEDPNQPRKTFDVAELRLLGEDMRDNGQHQAAGALPDGTLIYGGRRVAAAKLVGLPYLEVKIYDGLLTPTQIKVIQLTENLHRVDLCDQEVYLAAVELRRVNPTWKKQDLAAALHRSASAITHISSVDTLIPAAKEAFLGKAFGFSVAYEISKAESPQAQQELLAARFNGASRASISRQHGKAGNGNQQMAAKVQRAKFQLAKACVTIAGKFLSFDDIIESCLEGAKVARKAKEEGISIKTLEKSLGEKARAK